MWRFLGPNTLSGRVTDLAVDPADADHVLCTSETGGAFETRDGGRIWRPLFLREPCLATSALAVWFGATPAARVSYVGTGVSMGRYFERADGSPELFAGLGPVV